MSVLPNDRYEKTIAVAGQTVFNYDWDVPSAYPGQVKVIQYVLATHTKTTLTYGVDYTVDVANKRVTLTNAAAAGDTIVLYSGTPEARETDFTGSTVNVAAANEAIDNLTWQTQQLARDVKRCVRVDMVEGIMAGELPSVDDRKNKYASWDNDGNLTYDDPVTGILNDYMRKDQNLSDVANVATSRANLGLGDSATKNVGTTAGTVAAGNDARFLTQAQKDALTNGGDANAMHTHSGYIATAEKGAPNGVATLDANSKIPNAQLPDTAVTTATNVSTNNEVVLFNGVGGSEIKRSNKTLPTGNIVGTTDAQTLTNKTIDADNNTVSNLEVDNLKAGVLNTDLTGATSDTQVPSSKATKDYADTKCYRVHNLGTGVQVGHEGLNYGTAELRTLVAKDGIQLVQNENDIYVYGVPSETTFPIFDKQGNGAQWYKQTVGNHVEYRSFTGSNGVTVAQNGDEIDSSLTNITAQGDMIVGDNTGTASTLAKGADDQVLRMDGNDPQWETLGTMADQNADNVNIAGGTISGLATPLAVASGGTGLNALGTANYSLSVNGAGNALTWSLNDRLDNKHFAITNNTDLNTILTPGTYCCESGATTATLLNKPADMNNGAFLMIVRYITGNYWQQEIISNENKRWSRQYQISGTTWSDWLKEYVTPTTTQGDIIVRGAAADTRLAIGTAGQFLKVNAAGTDPEWGVGYETPTTTQGDLIVRGAAGDTRLGVGTAGQVLQVNAGGTDPEWATLGTMSAQNANAVNITGGTISGLATPLAVADGGTGLNAVGTANYSLVTNGNADALTWMLNDRLDGKHFDILANDDLNDAKFKIPGVYCSQSSTITQTLSNFPQWIGFGSFLMVVRYLTDNYWLQEITSNNHIRVFRLYRKDLSMWSDWQLDNGGEAFQYKLSTNFSVSAGTFTLTPFDTVVEERYSILDTATGIITPRPGYYLVIGCVMNYSNTLQVRGQIRHRADSSSSWSAQSDTPWAANYLIHGYGANVITSRIMYFDGKKQCALFSYSSEATNIDARNTYIQLVKIACNYPIN
jgi:hypothetical protein